MKDPSIKIKTFQNVKQDFLVWNAKKGWGKSKELNKTDIGWGHQIRSYVLQPYQLVKDLRNKIELKPNQYIGWKYWYFYWRGIKNK